MHGLLCNLMTYRIEISFLVNIFFSLRLLLSFYKPFTLNTQWNDCRKTLNFTDKTWSNSILWDIEIKRMTIGRFNKFPTHNAIVHRNFQKYSVKILYATIDWMCLGNPK